MKNEVNNKNPYREAGFSSIEFLCVLIFLSLFLLAVTKITDASSLEARKSQIRIAEKQKIEDTLQQVLSAYKTDITPYSDSKTDAFYKWNEKENENGVSVHLTSLSSKFNPNTELKDIFYKTELHALFKPGTSPDSLQQYREDNDFLFSRESINLFFEEETAERFFSVYNWLNPNTCDEFAFRKFVSKITGSEIAGELLWEKLRLLRQDKQLIKNNTDLSLFTGAYEKELSSFLTTQPLMNVHFMEPAALENLLNDSDFSINNPSDSAVRIIQAAENGELTESDLHNILGIDENNRLFYYLGTITWFWQIELECGNTQCSVILARDPQAENSGTDGKRVYMVEKAWN